MLCTGDLGLSVAALVLFLVVGPLLALVAGQRWRLAVARREEVRCLVLLAAEEAEREEMEAAVAYVVESPAVAATEGATGRPECAVCFSPTRRRCSRCKAVRYWSITYMLRVILLSSSKFNRSSLHCCSSGKCQIIHWRQGHKEECHPPDVDDKYNGQTNILDLKGVLGEQSNVSDISLEFEEQPHDKAVGAYLKRSSSESNCSTNIITEDKPEDKPAVDVSGNERTSDSFVSSARSCSTFSGITEASDDGSTSEEQPLCHCANPSESSSHDISPSSLRTTVDVTSMNFTKISPSEPASATFCVTSVPCSSKLKQKVSTSKTETGECESTAHSGVTVHPINTIEGQDTTLDMNVEHGAGENNFDTCQENACAELNVEASSKLSHKSSGKNSPFSTSSRNEDSLYGAASSEGTAKFECKDMQTVGTENSSCIASSGSTDVLLQKSARSKSFTSASSAVRLSSDGGGRPIVTHTSLKVDNAPTIPIRSSEGTVSMPNGLTTSVKRVVKQFTSPNVSRHYTSESMLFPYDHFIKLYNCDKVELHPCGFTNCGNSCYANAVLQCLAFTRPLTAYLLEGLHSKTCPKTEGCFTCELERLLMMAKQGKSPLSPAGILSHLSNIGSSFSRGREEDAHEFLRYAIEAMQSACLKEARKNVTGQLVEDTTLIQLIFGGYLRSKIKCMRCQGKSEHCERMMDLTVEIHGDIGTLEEALSRFTSTEILDGENKYQCDRCKSYERAKKKLTILEAPNILTIALKRFQSGKFGKLNKSIRFPEYLDLARYMSGTDDKFPVYRLYAVVVHLDIMNASFSGHYVCYVKDMQGKWYKIDDSMVIPVELERVLSKGAYMLLYARCSPRAPSSVREALTYEQVQIKKIGVKEAKAKSSSMFSQHGSSIVHRRSLFYSQQLVDDAANFQPYDLFDERIRSPEVDSSSDGSSLVSCSSECSGSSESTRDSTSTDEYSGFLFGESDRIGWDGPLRFFEDSDGLNHSPLSTLTGSSDSISNPSSCSGWEAGRLEVERIGGRKPPDKREGFLEGKESPFFLHLDPINQCRKLTEEWRTPETDRVKPDVVMPNVLFRRPSKERTAQTFY
ncbi:ubiquitin carboxyl-terminal hydrolase 15 [Cocos nucifera]|uniref:Ubiquitin carboxyl-terminal hydrolase 15 n=1 Tax=Cocos nucifera TaxID=13894 RepID=A0A8K0ITG1_COCNU|nr:ubiquitin carboxyl-terminal hydrolase 15 [Cocos nucifera]